MMTKGRKIEKVSLSDIQSELLRLFRLVQQICIDEKLNYWIDSGTLLGAVRHHGFIPWDDDLDLSLMKPDFDKLIMALGKLDANKDRAVLYYGENNCNYWSDYLASTEFVVRNFRGELLPCHIDIFPFKALSEADIEKDKAATNIAMYLVGGKIKYPDIFDTGWHHLSRTDSLKKKKEWMRWFNDEHIASLGRICDETEYLTYSFEDFPYNYERPKFRVGDIFPLKTASFMGLKVSVPSNSDGFLKLLYDDYRSLPAKSKQTPYHIGFYKVDRKTGAKIKNAYLRRQFANYYDRHRFWTVTKNGLLTAKHSGFRVLASKIRNYLRY